MINIYDSARYKLKKKWLLQIIEAYLTKQSVSPHLLINIVFVGRRKMLHIATTYKHEPEALPVLCFPYITDKRMIHADEHEPLTDASSPTPPQQLLGEVFICFPQAVLLAAEKRKTVEAMMTYLLHHAIDNLLLGREGTYKTH